jgi:hypothetical protein
MPVKFTFTGFDELKTQFDDIASTLTVLAEQALEDIMEQVLKEVEIYPPQPDRDRAKTFNRYVRGIGIYPMSAFNEAGELISLVAGIDRVIFSSEQLSTKWRTDIVSSIYGTKAVIRNLASYSDYVVGDMQTDFHEETGWPTVQGVVEELEPMIEENFVWVLDQIEIIALGGEL